MTLIEVLKSGKRFRRKGTAEYHNVESNVDHAWFPILEILADDWEVEDAKTEMTDSDLIQAFQDLLLLRNKNKHDDTTLLRSCYSLHNSRWYK